MNTPATTSTTSPAPLNAWTKPRQKLGGISAIAHLFQRLQGKFPAQWPRLFPTAEKVATWEAEWITEFLRLGITFAEVNRGLDNLSGKYTPNIGEFIAACRPPVDLEQTFHEAVDQMQRRKGGAAFRSQHPGQALPPHLHDSWSSPAVYWAAVKLGHDLHVNPWDKMRGRWAAAIAQAQKDIGTGAAPNFVPEPLLQIEEGGKQLTSRPEAQRRLADIAGRFGLTTERRAA